MTYTLDIEMFISEVKKHPALWDHTCEESRYRNKKEEAWAQIARIFMPEFDSMPKRERVEVCKKFNSKWRNIRDSYVRHVKKKYGKKGYMYAKHLSFLNNVYRQFLSDAEDQEWSEDDQKQSLEFKRRVEGTSEGWQSDEEGSLPLESLKRKKPKEEVIEYVDTPLLQDPTCSYPIEDEDKSFFDSLLPAVRSFNMDQKLEFRSEVICLIKNIRKRQKKCKLDPSTGEFDQ